MCEKIYIFCRNWDGLLPNSQAWSRYSRSYRDTTGMGAQGMGHDTTRTRPQHGRACATIRHAVRTIQPSARAGVAWLAEYVAIQRLYRDLGRHCVAIGAAIRRRMSHDTVLCACNTARHGARQGTRVMIQKLYRDRGRRQQHCDTAL